MAAEKSIYDSRRFVDGASVGGGSEHILHGSTGPVLNFGKEKVVTISTRSWRVMYPCVRTQRYDRKPLIDI